VLNSVNKEVVGPVSGFAAESNPGHHSASLYFLCCHLSAYLLWELIIRKREDYYIPPKVN
jgi:hypothetical protein